MFEDGIAVIGLGYIGLPTCAALTRHGLRVTGVDVNERTVSEINAGRVPIVEPNLDVAIAAAVADGLLTATTTMPHAVRLPHRRADAVHRRPRARPAARALGDRGDRADAARRARSSSSSRRRRPGRPS